MFSVQTKMSDSSDESDVVWTSALEQYLKDVAEQSLCRSIMYDKAFQFYNKRRAWFDIPIIVISSLTGFASVGSTTLFAGQAQIASVALGLASLAVSVGNTISSYYGFSKLAESNRIATISYRRMHMLLELQLRLPVDQRMRARDLLKVVRGEQERLSETSVALPESIKNEFRARFKEYADKVSWPSESNGLRAVVVNVEDPRVVRRPAIELASSE